MAMGDKIYTGMDAFNAGLANSQNIFNSLVHNRLEDAQTLREKKMAELPFGGANVPGPAGQIVGLEMIRQQYGDNSPQYKQAQQAFGLSQNSIGSRINYQTALTNSMPIRYTTPEGRQIIEQSNVAGGGSPAGTPSGQPIFPGKIPYNPNPGQPLPNTNNQTQSNDQTADVGTPVADIGTGYDPEHGVDTTVQPPPENNNGAPTASQHYSLRQAKQDLPTFVQQKNLSANNIEKTIKNVDLDALTNYNGVMGASKLSYEKARDLAGLETSEEYKKYKEAEAKFNFLGNQIRQFYGDSVQPSAMEALQKKLDPRSSLHGQKTGKIKFNSTKDLLEKELQTYRDASRDASVYTGANPSASKETVQVKTNESQNGKEPIIIMYKGSKEYHFPAKYANHSKLKGFTLEPT